MLSQEVQGQLGLAFAVTSQAEIKGETWDDANPLFNNFVYHHKLEHKHIAIKGKLLTEIAHRLLPWLSASFGLGFNEASSFESTPIIFEALPNAPFSSKTKNTFTYTLGIGLQKIISDHIQVGVGYEFSDWGKSELGPADGQLLDTGLSLNNFYTNGIIFNITYFM